MSNEINDSGKKTWPIFENHITIETAKEIRDAVMQYCKDNPIKDNKLRIRWDIDSEEEMLKEKSFAICVRMDESKSKNYKDTEYFEKIAEKYMSKLEKDLNLPKVSQFDTGTEYRDDTIFTWARWNIDPTIYFENGKTYSRPEEKVTYHPKEMISDLDIFRI